MNELLGSPLLLGLLEGVVAGTLTLLAGGLYPPLLDYARRVSTAVFDSLRQVFLRLLFFVVIPLVFASLANGVAQLERLTQLGPLALRTFMLFFLNMTIAVALGLAMMNLVAPGSAMEAEQQARLRASFGIPPEGIGIVLGVDRLLDMVRTMVNVGADLVTAAMVDEHIVLDQEPPPA